MSEKSRKTMGPVSTVRKLKARANRKIDPSLVTELNEAQITKHELLAYSEECNRLVPKDADDRDSFVGTTMIAARLSKNDATKAMALWSRMRALSRMVREGARGWVLENGTPDGMRLVEEAMFAAAVVEPLQRDNDGEYTFNRESFLNRVLQLAEQESTVQ